MFDVFLSWLPLYYTVKFAFLLWCFLPQTQVKRSSDFESRTITTHTHTHTHKIIQLSHTSNYGKFSSSTHVRSALSHARICMQATIFSSPRTTVHTVHTTLCGKIRCTQQCLVCRMVRLSDFVEDKQADPKSHGSSYPSFTI